jgi:HPt (histidine-containing phosphotransfer) domain-containing protein
MPEMDGYALSRHIRACEARNGHPRVPIIACTANALGGEAEKCFAAGMDDYLAKPIDLAALAQKLAHWLPLPDAAPAIPPSPAAVLDAALLSELSGGDAGVERDLLARFGDCNAKDAGALEEAARRRDEQAVAQAAHRIKGASRTIGAMRLAAACGRVEDAAREADWDEVARALDPFRAELAALDAFIASALPRTQSSAAYSQGRT